MVPGNCIVLVRESLWRIAPGVTAILDFTSRRKYGMDFAELFVNRPDNAYSVMLEAIHDHHWVNVIIRSLLAGLVDSGSVSLRELVETIRAGEEIDWSEYISGCRL
ncbi:MAG: hypothetical protein F7B59_01175 [Desulfurococcales archaeon]|nr:hypothetical protein [Desulfurococcales archaeon]